MDVSGQLHAPASLTPVPTLYGAGCSSETVRTLWKRAYFFPYCESNPDFLVAELVT
jgi:hypothetical protein